MNCLSLYGYVLRHRADDVDEPIPDSSARKEFYTWCIEVTRCYIPMY